MTNNNDLINAQIEIINAQIILNAKNFAFQNMQLQKRLNDLQNQLTPTIN